MKDGTLTRKGRVIYKRKKHEMRIKDLINMSIAMGKRDESWLREQAIGCRSLFIVVQNSLYPYYLEAIYDANTAVSILWAKMEPKIRAAWKEKTREICDDVGKVFKIPDNIRALVLKHFFDIIWDTIWKLTEPLFRGRH